MWYIHYWKAPRWTCSPPEVLLSRVVLAWVRSQFSEGESFKQWHGDFQIRLQDENMSNVTLCMCTDRLLLSYMEWSNISTVCLCSEWHTTIPYILHMQFCAKRCSIQQHTETDPVSQNAMCSTWLSISRVMNEQVISSHFNPKTPTSWHGLLKEIFLRDF